MSVRKFSSPPSAFVLFGRAALGSVPFSGRLPFLAGGGGEIPDLDLELDAIEIDPTRLADYAKVCGFALRETLPPTFPHVLGFPLHLALMTDAKFPFPAIGLVHISNRIRQHRPIDLRERLAIRVCASKLSAHPKGQSFRLLTEVTSAGELVWEGESENLRRGGGGGSQGDDSPGEADADPVDRTAPNPGLPDPRALTKEAEWSLPGDLGRRYAAVSGDHNPIHLYGMTAKAFGFPRQIAHGMWTKARCVAQIEARLPDAFEVEVAFKRPILLPGRVEFASDPAGAGIAFGVRDPRRGTAHLAGLARPA